MRRRMILKEIVPKLTVMLKTEDAMQDFTGPWNRMSRMYPVTQ